MQEKCHRLFFGFSKTHFNVQGFFPLESKAFLCLIKEQWKVVKRPLKVVACFKKSPEKRNQIEKWT